MVLGVAFNFDVHISATESSKNRICFYIYICHNVMLKSVRTYGTEYMLLPLMSTKSMKKAVFQIPKYTVSILTA